MIEFALLCPVLFAIVGYLIASAHGSSRFSAVLLCVLLGPIGVLLVLVTDPRPTCRECGGKVFRRARCCRHCGELRTSRVPVGYAPAEAYGLRDY